MKFGEVTVGIQLNNLTPQLGDPDVTCGFATDVLSHALANAPKGAVMVTIQKHMNVVAVAFQREVAAIIIASGRTPSAETVKQAVKVNIPIYVTEHSIFDIIGKLYERGLRTP